MTNDFRSYDHKNDKIIGHYSLLAIQTPCYSRVSMVPVNPGKSSNWKNIPGKENH